MDEVLFPIGGNGSENTCAGLSISLLSFRMSNDPTDDTSGAPVADDASEQKIAELTAQIAKLTDIAGRAQADLQNAKARMDRDAEDLRRFALQSIILKLLPVLDHFDRALKATPQELLGNEWVKGIEAIEKDFAQKLNESGLKKFESIGQPVDPVRHEVVTLGPGEEGIITEVFEDGYELLGKVVRVAKVKVGDGTA
jgi:molecular chaperone GrpE